MSKYNFNPKTLSEPRRIDDVIERQHAQRSFENEKAERPTIRTSRNRMGMATPANQVRFLHLDRE